MKLHIEKNLRAGKFFVRISVDSLTPKEKENIEKFGSPAISIEPEVMWINGRSYSNLLLHSFNYEFSFDTEQEAKSFAESISQRIIDAAKNLKEKEDKFTTTKDLYI